MIPAKAAKAVADKAAEDTKKACGKKKGGKSAYKRALRENQAVFDAAEQKAKDDTLKARISAVQKEVLRAPFFFCRYVCLLLSGCK